MDVKIQDGKYVGRVVDVKINKSQAGNPMVVIEWHIAEANLRRKSYHVTANTAGVRNERNINTLKAVFPDWDGANDDWFVENYDTCLNVSAQLVILNEEWQGRMVPNIKYVNPLKSGNLPPVPKRETAAPTPPKGVLPDEIKPTQIGVWGAFLTLHQGDDYPTIEKAWFALLDKTIIPQKDQDLYDEYDWRQVIAAMREDAKEVR